MEFKIITSDDLIRNWLDFVMQDLKIIFVEINGEYHSIRSNFIETDNGSIIEDCEINLLMLEQQIRKKEITSIITL